MAGERPAKYRQEIQQVSLLSFLCCTLRLSGSLGWPGSIVSVWTLVVVTSCRTTSTPGIPLPYHPNSYPFQLFAAPPTPDGNTLFASGSTICRRPFPSPFTCCPPTMVNLVESFKETLEQHKRLKAAQERSRSSLQFLPRPVQGHHRPRPRTSVPSPPRCAADELSAALPAQDEQPLALAPPISRTRSRPFDVEDTGRCPLTTIQTQQMMFVSGETAEPSTETTWLIEEIVREQVLHMVRTNIHPIYCFSN